MNGLEFCVPNSRGWSWWRLVIVANLPRPCGWSSSSLVIVVVVGPRGGRSLWWLVVLVVVCGVGWSRWWLVIMLMVDVFVAIMLVWEVLDIWWRISQLYKYRYRYFNYTVLYCRFRYVFELALHFPVALHFYLNKYLLPVPVLFVVFRCTILFKNVFFYMS